MAAERGVSDMAFVYQQPKDTAAAWTTANPTLPEGVLAYESDTGRWKLGDGSTAWNSLGYLTVAEASAILSKLLTVDGASSGLDADLLDGNHASAFATSGHNHDSVYATATDCIVYAIALGG